MRNYEHFIVNHEILLPDPTSAKAAWGLHQPEYLDEDSPHFLRKGHTTFPHSEVIYQLTEASRIIGTSQGKSFGHGIIVGEIQDYSGGYHEGGVHESKIIWES